MNIDLARKIRKHFHKIEDKTAFVVILLLGLFPVLEIIFRTFFKSGFRGSTGYIKNLVVWITFLGAMITARKGDHLSFSAILNNLKGKLRNKVLAYNTVIFSSFCIALFWSSLALIFIAFPPSQKLLIVPLYIVVLIMPLSFLVMAFRSGFNKKLNPGLKRILSVSAVVLGTLGALPSIVNILYILFAEVPVFIDSLLGVYDTFSIVLKYPLVLSLIAAGILGTPIFLVLGSIAYVLFAASGGALEAIPEEAYSMLTGPSIPAIPLFTFAGFILSESNAGKRFVDLFRAYFGWLPGGLVIMTVLVCAFFTTFTGASGVTILALGALLSYVMVKSGNYEEDFSDGLIASSGSIGLLFPPSLPIILYGVTAQISIKQMFLGGIIPGAIMVCFLVSYGLFKTVKMGIKTEKFDAKKLVPATLSSFWEILIPVIILLAYFGGFTTISETGAVAVVYCLIVEVLIKKDLKLRDLYRVVKKCIPVIGGVLMILAIARGLSYYIIDAQIPYHLSKWVAANISSKIVFLIILNIGLLITGCFMDIFSAIMVVAPLIFPLGDVFGIHPVHLGIIFLANLELGYLTPPVGLNLFLASYRFEKPLGRIYKDVFPFFIAQLLAVILITYVPWLSTVLVK